MEPRRFVLRTETVVQNALVHIGNIKPDDKQPCEVICQPYERETVEVKRKNYFALLTDCCRDSGLEIGKLHVAMKYRFIGAIEYEYKGVPQMIPMSTGKLKTVKRWRLFIADVEEYLRTEYGWVRGNWSV